MFEPQSIIVYHSPAEAALWESGMVFPFVVGIFFAAIAAVAAGIIMNMLAKRFDFIRRMDHSVPAIVAGLFAMLYTLYKFGAI